MEKVRQLERKNAILVKLAEISASLNSQYDLQPLLQYIMQVAVEITDCEAASVLLWDSQHQELFFAASTTVDNNNELVGRAVPMESIAGTILRQNEIVIVNDTRRDQRHYDQVDKEIAFQTRSLLGVPMRYKDRVIGVLEALNKRTLPWTKDDSDYLMTLAAQAAVAIQGAQLVMELKRANDELSEVDKLKNDFIAIASHELRTPLGVIMGYASFLQDSDSPDTQEHATKVLESALRLRKIIEDMVNLRYLKQKQSDLHREETDVRTILDLVRIEIDAVFDVSHHDFQIKYPAEGLRVYVDQTRLSMALMSYVHNAFTFTPQGGKITIDVQATPSEVRFRVADTGIGIESDKLERIFEEFYQVEDHMIRHHGGLGIGLSIARAIATAHRGRAWAESAGLGKGATFYLSLPRLT
ncbi:GAF domain-containing sensor histidine kinase [Aggregatilineales bacterium SYSU G02658]